jgi:hypothetical protein
MRTLLLRSLRLALLVPLLQLGIRPAHAAEPEKPWKQLFEHCQKLSTEGDYSGALEKCQQAHALNPDPGILAYIAQIHIALLQPVQARDVLVLYLQSKEIDPADRKTAEAQVRYLDSVIGTLTVITKLEGAEIRVDDRVIDASALAKGVPLPAWTHQVTLKAQGATYRRTITLHGGEQIVLELPGDEDKQPSTAQSEPRVAAVSPAPKSNAHPPQMNPRGYWITGTGLALGVAALTTGIYNGTQYNRWETANDNLRNDLKDNTVTVVEAAHRAQENDQLMDSIKTGRKVAVGLGVASALVTTGGVLLLLSDSKAPTGKGSNSWFRKVATGVTVNGGLNSGEIAWRGAW